MGDVVNMPIFHLHFPHHPGKKDGIPKGCLAVLVGQEGAEQRQRFVLPVVHLNHLLFAQLLKEAEDEYGFEQKGIITIPCHVAQFRYVRSLIDRETPRHHVGCLKS